MLPSHTLKYRMRPLALKKHEKVNDFWSGKHYSLKEAQGSGNFYRGLMVSLIGVIQVSDTVLGPPAPVSALQPL